MEKEKYKYKYRKKSHYFNVLLLFLMAVFFITIYTLILQKNYSSNTLEAEVDRDIACSDAIHKLVSDKFTREDFTQINTTEDMSSRRYKELQASLNEIRSLNSTRYLYTAKRNAEGKLIYLVDGLDLSAEDFAYPGTYIEEEMIPYINSALSGETVYSQEIMDTTWGHIFTACYPIEAGDDSGDIIGALCIEIDMESAYTFLEKNNRTSFGIADTAILIAVLLFSCIYIYMQKQKKKELEQQRLLEESAAAADAANKAKSTFLFNMSHDIRTPMNAIIGYAELADKYLLSKKNSGDEDTQKLKGYMDNIRICGKKMLSIIDNVLELARIENNETVLEETAVKTGDILDSGIVMFHRILEEKHQTLTMEKNIKYPYVYMDQTYVSEIQLNIVSNAIKYTGEGGKISCSLNQKPHEKEGWCITEFSVTDTGIGMSEEFQKHIFDSFSRERSSTASGIEGTGLGMGIVKKLLDMMNGTIEIHSKLGGGSTFTVRIPMRIATEEEAQPKRADDQMNNKSLQGKRILLAEDNDLNAEIAIELLSEEGLIIERAENGVICVEMLEKSKPDYYDLILMDIQMPVMDGYTATQKIRKLDETLKADIPIIAMTANAFAEDREKALAVGMNEHIAKPIDMNTLIPVLQRYLAHNINSKNTMIPK